MYILLSALRRKRPVIPNIHTLNSKQHFLMIPNWIEKTCQIWEMSHIETSLTQPQRLNFKVYNWRSHQMSENFINVSFWKLTVRRVRNVPTRHRSSTPKLQPMAHLVNIPSLNLHNTCGMQSVRVFPEEKLVPRVSSYRKLLPRVFSAHLQCRNFPIWARSWLRDRFTVVMMPLKLRSSRKSSNEDADRKTSPPSPHWKSLDRLLRENSRLWDRTPRHEKVEWGYQHRSANFGTPRETATITVAVGKNPQESSASVEGARRSKIDPGAPPSSPAVQVWLLHINRCYRGPVDWASLTA